MSDLISRQLLIGAIEKCGEEKIYPQALIQTINALPNAEPSGDLISRQEVHKVLSLLATEGGKDAKLLFSDAHESIDALPSADRPQVNSAEWVEQKEREFEELHRPKGEWIRKEDNVSWWVECSKCGEKPLLNVYSHTYEKTPYCPSCGADMRGEKDD